MYLRHPRFWYFPPPQFLVPCAPSVAFSIEHSIVLVFGTFCHPNFWYLAYFTFVPFCIPLSVPLDIPFLEPLRVPAGPVRVVKIGGGKKSGFLQISVGFGLPGCPSLTRGGRHPELGCGRNSSNASRTASSKAFRRDRQFRVPPPRRHFATHSGNPKALRGVRKIGSVPTGADPMCFGQSSGTACTKGFEGCSNWVGF